VNIAYDKLGRRLAMTRSSGAGTSYAYDGASRLTSLGQDLANTAYDQTITLGYNYASQIASRSGANDAYAFTALTSGTTGSSVNGLNQLTVHGAATITHDAKGNLTSDGSTTFVYDGDRLIEEYNSAGVLLRRYVHGSGADEPLVRYDGSTLRFLHADERGSIIAASQADGSIWNVSVYDEYGVRGIWNDGTFQYTGQVWLGELGLYYYKARFYDPGKGRFMQVDPIGYQGGSNLYEYADSDPVNRRDATGLAPGDLFNTAADAAIDAIRYINARSIKENKEYRGLIRQNTEGKFYATTPKSGQRGQVRVDIVKGAKGDYHTHGDYSRLVQGTLVRTDKQGDTQSSDQFSQDDKALSRRARTATEYEPYKSYLGTPSGQIRQYDPATRQDTPVIIPISAPPRSPVEVKTLIKWR
jgi:RHS repeat-associated protein